MDIAILSLAFLALGMAIVLALYARNAVRSALRENDAQKLRHDEWSARFSLNVSEELKKLGQLRRDHVEEAHRDLERVYFCAMMVCDDTVTKPVREEYRAESHAIIKKWEAKKCTP